MRINHIVDLPRFFIQDIEQKNGKITIFAPSSPVDPNALSVAIPAALFMIITTEK